MSISLKTNITSMVAQTNVNQAAAALNGSIERISSGQRVNIAKDDAAGYAISEKLKAKIAGLAQAERSANDVMSMLQTAEQAIGAVSDVLIRMRELAIQASNDTFGTQEKTILANEYQAMKLEIDRIAATTEFNGIKLLQSIGGTFQFNLGINGSANDMLSVALASINTRSIGSTVAVYTTSISNTANAISALGVLDAALNDVSVSRANLGTKQKSAEIILEKLRTARFNFTATNSRIRDLDVAEETAKMSQNQILTQAGISVLSSANQNTRMVLQLLQG